jgi:hypothetical protein
LEVTKTSFRKRMDSEMFLSANIKWAIKPWKDMEESLIDIVRRRKPIWKY